MIGTSVISADYLLFKTIAHTPNFQSLAKVKLRVKGQRINYLVKLEGLWMEYVDVRPRFGTMRDVEECGVVLFFMVY